MPHTPSTQKEVVSIIVRAPRDLVEAFDKALKLGYFNAKSRNEAIVKVMREALSDIFFAIQAVKKGEEKAKTLNTNSSIPREFLYMQLAFELLAETPASKDIEDKYASLIAITGSRLKTDKEQFEQLNTLLQHLFEED